MPQTPSSLLRSHHLTKAFERNFSQIPQIFLSKAGKVQKRINCLIMLINASQYDFLEKIIFGLQISIPRVLPVHISSRSDYCITNDIM